MFGRFRKKKDTKTQTPNTAIKTMFVMAFTTEKMPVETLQSVVQIAQGMLQKKNPAFAKLLSEQMKPETKIEVANLKYAGSIMHTPQTMQTSLGGWIKNQYQVSFTPFVNKNFFPHGMRDPQGKENFFLFYFDM